MASKRIAERRLLMRRVRVNYSPPLCKPKYLASGLTRHPRRKTPLFRVWIAPQPTPGLVIRFLRPFHSYQLPAALGFSPAVTLRSSLQQLSRLSAQKGLTEDYPRN